jgi:hypothetical protein
MIDGGTPIHGTVDQAHMDQLGFLSKALKQPVYSGTGVPFVAAGPSGKEKTTRRPCMHM